MLRKKHTALVYSTELGRTCRDCGAPTASCRCGDDRIIGDGNVRVGREVKGRGGKAVTVITGLPLDRAALAELATRIKKHVGSGGTAKDGTIEIQGDHRDAVLQLLTALGYRVKRGGG